MNTNDANVNKRLDKFIAKGKTADYYDFSDINMYYPPIKFESWQDKIKKFFTSLIK